MNYIMSDIKIFVINDAVLFSSDNKTSILDKNRQMPIYDKKDATIVDFVKDNGENTYYTTRFPQGVIDFLNGIKPKSAIGKQISSVYKRFKSNNHGLAQFFDYCDNVTISDEELLSLYTDIANGYDRKKAVIRVANRFGTDDFSEISERAIKLELEAIYKERSAQQTLAYKSFEDDFIC